VCTGLGSGCDQCSCGDSPSCLMKRPRSLQHIAAANSTRQRILRSMSAAGAAAAAHQPIPVPTPAGSSTAGGQQNMCSTSSHSSASSSSVGLRSSGHGLPGTSSSGHMPSASCVVARHRSSDESSRNIPFFESNTRSSSDSHRGQRQVPLIPRLQQAQLGASYNADVAAVDEAVRMDVDCDQQQPVAALQTHQQPAAAEFDESAAAPAPWSDLPVEVMAQVARFMGSTVAAVAPLCRTCRSARHMRGGGARRLLWNNSGCQLLYAGRCKGCCR
jgi:hypothetical protein